MKRIKIMGTGKLKECPFCGDPIVKKKGRTGVSLYICNNEDCYAYVCFGGFKPVGHGFLEARRPDENWNRRAGEKTV